MKRQSPRSISRYLCLACFVFSLTLESVAAPLTVRIGSDFPIIGNVTIKIFQSLENFYQGTTLTETGITMNAGSVEVVFPDIPDGTYIVSIHHDGNGDGTMNSNAFGVPIETSLFYDPADPAGADGPRNAPFELSSGNRTLEAKLGKPPADPRAWGAGVMVLLSSNPYRGGDIVFRALPLLTHVGERFFIVGPRGGFNLVKTPWLSMNILAEAKFAGDAFEDEDFLAGMEKRRDTAMAGLDASMKVPKRLRLEMSVLTDVLDRHNGQEVSMSLSRNFRGKRWSVTPGIGAVWRTSNYNQYYFGVGESEATPERPAYKADGDLDALLRVFYRLEISESWSLLASGRMEFLGGEIRNSPIVDKDYVLGSFMGINYAF